ncbi:MAG: 7-cyano-7-deazaguanine synthase, partial [Clostridia bacterium]|nr:7-cyano-7-deazaguanine synthase [Clostridia bacterium]
MRMAKVIVGMSGGVDSAVAAYLLKKDGHEVTGVTLRTWQAEDGSESRCCDIDDARRVANVLGIKYVPVNCTLDFQKYVVDPFTNDYLRGMTPNPCVVCNRYVKWDKLLYYAKALGAEYVATGHYAYIKKLENGRYTVKKAKYSQKDQTY